MLSLCWIIQQCLFLVICRKQTEISYLNHSRCQVFAYLFNLLSGVIYIFCERAIVAQKAWHFPFCECDKEKEQSEIVFLYDFSDYVPGYMYCVKINPGSIKKKHRAGHHYKVQEVPRLLLQHRKNVPGVSIENEVVQTNIRTCVRITTILRICIVSNTPSMLFSRPKCNRSPLTNHQQPSDQEYPVAPLHSHCCTYKFLFQD